MVQAKMAKGNLGGCLLAHTQARTHTHTHTHTTHTHTHTHAHKHTHTTHTHTHTPTRARMHARTHACTHARTHARTYASTYAHTQTHTHTHTYISAFCSSLGASENLCTFTTHVLFANPRIKDDLNLQCSIDRSQPQRWLWLALPTISRTAVPISSLGDVLPVSTCGEVLQASDHFMKQQSCVKTRPISDLVL